jgi:hypothetical protein
MSLRALTGRARESWTIGADHLKGPWVLSGGCSQLPKT